ncbi:MAG: hypothetical protein ABJC51_03720, partial [Acidobacteriota bacterium]
MRIKAVDAAVPASDPQPAVRILIDRRDVVTRQAAGVLGIVTIDDELAGLRSQPPEASAAGSDPELAVAPRQNRQDAVRRLRKPGDLAAGRPVAQQIAVEAADPDVAARIRGQDRHRPEIGERLSQLSGRFRLLGIDLEQPALGRGPDRRARPRRQRGDAVQRREGAVVQRPRAPLRIGGIEDPQPAIGSGKENPPVSAPDQLDDFKAVNRRRTAVEAPRRQVVTIEPP